MNQCKLRSLINAFDTEQSEAKPTFKMLRQYMTMMRNMLLLIRSVRTGNWNSQEQSMYKYVLPMHVEIFYQ